MPWRSPWFPGRCRPRPPRRWAGCARCSDATQKLSYTGTFVYQNGGRSETSRITRFVDAGGDIEKLEVMDGVPREIVRTKDTVRCYLPGARLVKVDRRTERGFPALLPERITALAQHYDISLGETRAHRRLRLPGGGAHAEGQPALRLPAVRRQRERHAAARGHVRRQRRAGRAVHVHPARDRRRDARHGAPRHASRNWRVEDAEASPARLAGWGLSSELPGFHKVVELKRRLGDSRPAAQMVYSDGLAAVSVFIESLEGRPEPVRPGLASMGAIHIYTREVANHMVTVVGEAPAASVQRIANAVEYRRPQ